MLDVQLPQSAAAAMGAYLAEGNFVDAHTLTLSADLATLDVVAGLMLLVRVDVAFGAPGDIVAAARTSVLRLAHGGAGGVGQARAAQPPAHPALAQAPTLLPHVRHACAQAASQRKP